MNVEDTALKALTLRTVQNILKHNKTKRSQARIGYFRPKPYCLLQSRELGVAPWCCFGAYSRLQTVKLSSGPNIHFGAKFDTFYSFHSLSKEFHCKTIHLLHLHFHPPLQFILEHEDKAIHAQKCNESINILKVSEVAKHIEGSKKQWNIQRCNGGGKSTESDKSAESCH